MEKKLYRFKKGIPVAFENFYEFRNFETRVFEEGLRYETLYEFCKGYDYVSVIKIKEKI